MDWFIFHGKLDKPTENVYNEVNDTQKRSIFL